MNIQKLRKMIQSLFMKFQRPQLSGGLTWSPLSKNQSTGCKSKRQFIGYTGAYGCYSNQVTEHAGLKAHYVFIGI